MGTLISVCRNQKFLIFLNISFLLFASILWVTYSFVSSEFLLSRNSNSLFLTNRQSCEAFENLENSKSKCFYLKSHNNPCVSQGYIDYLYLFYCNFGVFHIWGYFLLLIWLLVLFYLLGDTASEYFCSSLESLSRLLKLSPAIAGVTLLSLGNGAPDVFSSLVSFMGSGTNDIGLNTVVGGALFVTCVVVGAISISLHSKHVRVDKVVFVRDFLFFIVVIAFLVLILIHGEISLWGAIGFSSMYVVYVIVVYVSSTWYKNVEEVIEGDDELSVPILNDIEKSDLDRTQEGNDLESERNNEGAKRSWGKFICFILKLPLYLPRRLTIPVVSEKGWSKPMAVISVTLSPLLLLAIWEEGFTSTKINAIGLILGGILGILAFFTLEKSSPPKKYLFAWLTGGFFMSVIWSYIIAQELVALLASMGYIFGISPSILGLTVLAWGNSLGDLIANLTLALKDGPQGAQVAISGCYAGPLFNILFGLGLSLVGSCWYTYPSPLVITKDPYLLEILGFLVGGLVWAFVVLPRKGMRLDGLLGGGLLVIYLVSLSLRLIQTLGSLPL